MILQAHLSSHYDRVFVAVSVGIAMVASFAALVLAGRVTAAKGPIRALWLWGGAFAMGVGIWSMHYIAMLAFDLPIPVLYDVPTVALSLLAAVLASAIALWVVSRNRMGLAQAIPGSVLMGAAIALMHYIGMAAMRLGATAHYDPALVALSIGVAIVVSFVALGVAFALRADRAGRLVWRKVVSAILMGAAIPCMHYTAMAAVRFRESAVPADSISGTGIPSLGAWAIILTSLVVLGVAILTAFTGRRLADSAHALATSEGVRQAQEQFFRDVIDASPHLVFARNEAGRYVMANKAFAAWHGVSADEVVGKTGYDLPGTHEQIQQMLHQDRMVISSGVAQSHQDVMISNSATGENRWFDVVKVPLRSAATADCYALGIATDITNRRQLEEQLRQAQKMEAVGLLAGGVAHDFNNMLTAIMGRTDLLLEETGPADPHQSDMLEIRRAAQRAAELTHQLLAFSRRQVLQPKVFDLNALIGEVLSMVRRLIGEDIVLRAVNGAERATIKADPGQIEQVLVNLALNARDAMPRGGSLTIETSDVTIEESADPQYLPLAPGRYVLVSMSDTGFGMSAETRSHMFEPFFTTKKPGQGTGLGLATAYGIVKQSGGHIGVYSEPGLGTTFRVYFPRVQIAAEVRIEPAPVAPSRLRGRETILVVEDEDAVRQVTCTILEKRGYQILVASTGDEALQLALQYRGPIHLLLTDVVMPGMSGRDLAERLGPLRPETRVLFVSGYTSDAVVHHGVEEGVPFLQKPFAPDSLAVKVREVLGSRKGAGAQRQALSERT